MRNCRCQIYCCWLHKATTYVDSFDSDDKPTLSHPIENTGGDDTVNCSAPENRNKDREDEFVSLEETADNMENQRSGMAELWVWRSLRWKSWRFIVSRFVFWTWEIVIIIFKCYIKDISNRFVVFSQIPHKYISFVFDYTQFCVIDSITILLVQRQSF